MALQCYPEFNHSGMENSCSPWHSDCSCASLKYPLLIIIQPFELEWILKGHLVQLPCNAQRHLQLHQGAQSPIQPKFEHISRNGVFTTSLGNLFQCFTNLILKIFILLSSINISPCPVAIDSAKESVPFFLSSPLDSEKPLSGHLSLLFSRLNSPSSLSCPHSKSVVFHPLDHFCGLPLDTLQQVHLSPVLRTPHEDAVLQMRSHQCRIERQDHLPQPACHASFDIAQDTVGFVGCEGTLLAHVHLAIHQYPRVLFVLAVFCPQVSLLFSGLYSQMEEVFRLNSSLTLSGFPSLVIKGWPYFLDNQDGL